MLESGNEPVTQWEGKTIPLEEAIKRHDVSPILKRFGDWAITTYGVECLMDYYPIEAARLQTMKDADEWERHLYGKVWAQKKIRQAAIALHEFVRDLEAKRNPPPPVKVWADGCEPAE